MNTRTGFRHKASLLACTALMALPLSAGTAWAQAAGDEEASAKDEILVTAQRRSERLEDVPMSVAVVSAETLATNGINTIRDLANVTSGFQLNQSGTYPQPAIRGVTTANAGSYENNVALWVDGLYQITPQVLNLDLPNVENVQILKGPQGALYGRNATGGAILIDTIDPGSTMTGNAEATYGRFSDRRLRGYVTGPLSEKVGFSLAGTYRKTGGYYKKVNLTNPAALDGRTLGMDQQSVRAKIKASLTDTFTATIGYNFIRSSDPRGTYFTPVENLSAGYPIRQLGEVAGDAFKLDFRQHEASLKLELETGIGTLRSVTGYQKSNLVTQYDSDGRYSTAGASSATETISDSKILGRSWQENLDFTINAIDRLDLILGATYFQNKEGFAPGRANANYWFPTGNAAAGPGTPLSAYTKISESDSDRTKKAWAAFFDATFHATDRLTINVGGRYSSETQNISAKKTCYIVQFSLGCPVTTAVPAIRYDASARSKYSKFTPRASIRFEVSPRTNVYATYSQGFKAGEWNGVIPGDDPANWFKNGQIGQESINAYEVGLKSGGGRVRFDLSGFYYDYKDLQISSVQFVNGVTSVLLQSIPKARIYGLEGNVEFDVTDNFKVRAGGTWLDAKYGAGAIYRGGGVDPSLAVAAPNADDPLKGLRNTSPVAPLYQDISGTQLVRAPDFTGYIGAEYNIPKGDGGIRIAANVKYTTSYVPTDAAIWGGEQPASYLARQATAAAGTVVLPNNSQIFTAAGAAGAPYLDRANEQRTRQGGYALVNASITWTEPSGHAYVRVWGNNLTNKIYATHKRVSSRTYTPIGEPLTFGGTVGYKF